MRKKLSILLVVALALVLTASTGFATECILHGDAERCHTLALESVNQRVNVSELDSLTLWQLEETMLQTGDEELREFMEQVLKGYHYIYIVTDLSEFSPRAIFCCNQMFIWQGSMGTRHNFNVNRICISTSEFYVRRCTSCGAIHDSWLVPRPGCGFNCGN